MEEFERNENIISSILNRCLNCMEINELYVYGNIKEDLDSLYTAIRKYHVTELAECEKAEVVYIRIEKVDELEETLPWIKKNRETKDIFLYLTEEKIFGHPLLYDVGNIYPFKVFSGTPGGIMLLGKTFVFPEKYKAPDNFKVLSILHFYNEADIIDKTIEYLLDQDIDIYLIDNWSNDGSYEIALSYQRRYPDKVFLRRFPEEGKTDYFQLYDQLEQTERISKKLDYNWYVHYDADEIRLGPWKNQTLKEAIYKIDQLGYNLIENTVIDHKLTEKDQKNIFNRNTYFEFGHRKTHFMQIKTWKKSMDLDLKTSGGHIAKIPNPRIFPLKILNRHFPFRDVKQAEIKIHRDRMPRFTKEKAERGWHGQYDRIRNIIEVVKDSSDLFFWNDEVLTKLYIPIFLGCAVRIEESAIQSITLPTIKRDCNVIIYGAGNIGKMVYQAVYKTCNVVAWVDTNFTYSNRLYAEKIQSPDIIKAVECDYVIIAVKNSNVQNAIRERIMGYGIAFEQIILPITN